MRRLIASILVAGALSPAAAIADPKTERTWKAKCASCHGGDGKGDTDVGKKQGIRDMTSAAWQGAFTDAQLRDATLNGLHRARDGKQQDMEGYKGKLSDEQVAALVAYMRALKK